MEAFKLVDGIIKFTVGIGYLLAVYEELEPLRESRYRPVLLGKR